MSRQAVSPEELRRELEKIVGPKRVSVREVDLATYSRDMWPRLLIAQAFGPRSRARTGPRPYAVVWPESPREVAALVRLARAQKIPIIPYGGGSGVCGGVIPLAGGITLDLKRMDAIRGIDSDDMICDVEAGVNGERFERELRRRGYTFGHFPSSMYCSTVGGWLATRAAGQMSTKYGKVEDRVAGLTVVTGRGEILESDELARAVRGPSWTQLVLGSEGTFGIITSARLRLSLQPALQVFRAYEFASVTAGVDAIRRVMQRGIRPAVVRLYDELDTFINNFKSSESSGASRRDPALFGPAPAPGSGALPTVPGPDEQSAPEGRLRGLLGTGVEIGRRMLGRDTKRLVMSAALARPRLTNLVAGVVSERVARKGCQLIIGLEGARIRTEVEAEIAFSELERAGGRDMGEEPGRAWLRRRYAISYQMSPTFRSGAFVDTMEVAATWERLMDLYESVREALSRHALVLAHFSHAYQEGCSIYFTFIARGTSAQEAEQIYDAIWRDGLAAATRVGGTISHHHGIGMLKAGYMAAEHREAMEILRALKDSFDPDGIMNPGKLGLAGGSR